MNWLRFVCIVFVGSIGLIIVVLVMAAARDNYESWGELLVAWTLGILQAVGISALFLAIILAMAYAIWGHL